MLGFENKVFAIVARIEGASCILRDTAVSKGDNVTSFKAEFTGVLAPDSNLNRQVVVVSNNNVALFPLSVVTAHGDCRDLAPVQYDPNYIDHALLH